MCVMPPIYDILSTFSALKHQKLYKVSVAVKFRQGSLHQYYGKKMEILLLIDRSAVSRLVVDALLNALVTIKQL